jgi:hypothetical protein
LKITQALITVYNATIYANFNNTIAFDLLKLAKIFFNVIKIYTLIFMKAKMFLNIIKIIIKMNVYILIMLKNILASFKISNGIVLRKFA